MRTIGPIGRMSWQSSKLDYEQINQLVAAAAGRASSARIIVHSLDFAPIADMQSRGDWACGGFGSLARAERGGVEAAGAEVIAIGANTMHKLAAEVAAATSCPSSISAMRWRRGCRGGCALEAALLGTRYTMEDPAILLDHPAAKGWRRSCR